MSTEMLPLTGVRVVDFTWAAAGPACTQTLTFLGAEVIKVESRQRSDGYRRSSLQNTGSPNRSSHFNDINAGKWSITVNLARPEGVRLVKHLITVSDALVENFSPGVMDRLGLGYKVLREIRPDLVMLSGSAAGGTGPHRGNVGYAPIFSAYSGLSYITGYPDAPPTDLIRPVDIRVGFASAFAILTALHHRLNTGEGQYIDLSAQEVLDCFMGEILMDAYLNKRDRRGEGNCERGMAPNDCFRCAGEDSWVSIAVGTEEEWQSFCSALGNPPWCHESRFSDPYQRWVHQEEMNRYIEEWTGTKSPWEVTDILQRAGVAAFPSCSAKDYQKDPHLKERRFFFPLEHAEVGWEIHLGAPWQLLPLSLRPSSVAPLLGEQNERVLSHLLGVEPDQIDELGKREVIY